MLFLFLLMLTAVGSSFLRAPRQMRPLRNVTNATLGPLAPDFGDDSISGYIMF